MPTAVLYYTGTIAMNANVNILSTSVKAHIQRKRKVRDDEDLEQFPEVLRLVSRSGFLKVNELGRLLLFSSPSFIGNLFTEAEIWTLLLHSRFAFDSETLRSLPMSAKETFLSYSKQEERRPSVIVRALCYSPKDYEIIINMFRVESLDEAFFSTIVRGEDAPDFFKNGKIQLNDAGSFRCHPEGDILATIHIHRLTDGKTICIHRARNIEFDGEDVYFEDGPGDAIGMEDLVYARSLVCESDISCWSGLMKMDFDLKIDSEEFQIPIPMEPWGFMAQGFIICVAQTFSVAQLNVRVDIDNYHDVDHFPKDPKDVTFAHFLEGLYSWNH